MVRKILHILRDPSSRVVAVTFTRDGAEELHKRVKAAAQTIARDQRGPDTLLRRFTAGTFHSLTLRHLQKHGKVLRIASPAQQRTFLERVRRQMCPDADPGEFQQAFEALKCTLRRGEDGEVIPWFEAYEQILRRNNLVDLYDVMRIAVQGFQDGSVPPLDCTHLIVDEAQDNDQIQAAWVGAHRRAIVTEVGDDDQTIYEWRRAIGFPGMVAFQRARNAKVVLLQDNFRSRAEILEAAGAVIAHNNPYRNDKQLVARRGAGGEVVRVAVGSSVDACTAVTGLLEPHLLQCEDGTRGVETGSWAVLARTNQQLDTVDAALTRAEIRSFRTTGTAWDRPEAQVCLAVLRSLLTADSVGVDMLLSHARVNHESITAVLEANRADLGALLDNRGKLTGVPEQTRMVEIFGRTAKWRRMIAEGALSMAARAVATFTLSHIDGRHRGTAGAVLEALEDRFAKLCRKLGDPERAISALLLEASRRTGDRAVLLYTMHGSKGLEFDNVIIVGADNSVIPGDVRDLPPGAQALTPGESTVQSERRLFYVAMTRAKDRLYIVHNFADPSLFVRELPPHIRTITVASHESDSRPAAA